MSVKKYFILSAIILIVILAFLLFYFAKVRIRYAWLLSINLITLLFYGYDKYKAGNNGTRIPEIVLHLLALIGGSPCALAGQLLFRHKIRKWKFLAVFVIIVIIQIVIMVYWINRNS
ncbi:MAG: DUF1294 domain-containing protein [Phycisphaerae bacterium]|nr:DUF1294 domain-containing protein [Phycisphaerae bacterium]